MNKLQIQKLYINNKIGINLVFQLSEKHNWVTNYDARKKYCINLPVNEIYTVPEKNKVNGVYKSKNPIEYNGVILRDIAFNIINGQVISLKCKFGKEYLDHILKVDLGARYIGEIALVFNDKEEIKSMVLFNSIIDENIRCHFALGAAHSRCIINSDKMTVKEYIKQGVNLSKIHIDFTFDYDGLNISAETKKNNRYNI